MTRAVPFSRALVLLATLLFVAPAIGARVRSVVRPRAAVRMSLEQAMGAYKEKYGEVRPGTYYHRDDSFLRATYKELARIYSDDVAAYMVDEVPSVLSFNPTYFQPTLDVFAEKYGRDKAVALMVRNPALLSVKPSGAGGADSANDSVIVFSYIVEITRPVGGYLLGTLFALLLVRPFEFATGFPLREVAVDAVKGAASAAGMIQ